MNRALRRFAHAFTTMHGQRALVLYRVITGCTILYQFLAALPERHFLFGPQGVYPLEIARSTATFGLMSSVTSVGAFEALYFGSIVITALWTMGLLLPVSTLLVLVVWRSMLDRLPALADGGDNLTQLLLIYALLCHLGGPRRSTPRWSWPAWVGPLRAMVHNTGLLAIWAQICVVYFIAGISKLQGEAWRNGTALYYALSTEKYTLGGLVDPLLDSPFLLTGLAYATVLFQVGFPFLVLLDRRSRRIALVIALGFHFGIATVMGLTSFAVFMIAADLTLLSDTEVSNLSAWLERRWLARRGGSDTQQRHEDHEPR